MTESPRKIIEKEFPALADELCEALSPCVIADSEPCSDDGLSVGATKFCGNPDVPPGFVWPMTADGPCWFLGQLNFADCSQFCTGIELPTDGLLSFFYHDAGGPAGAESQIFQFRSAGLERIDIVEDSRWGPEFHERHHFPRSMQLRQGYLLPEIKDLGLSAQQINEHDHLDEFIEDFNDHDGTHQFFGLPRWVWQKTPQNHRLVASFGECEDRILYFVPDAAIEAKEFESARVLYECT